MKSLPASLILEKNKLASPNPWLVLLTITLTDSTILRFVRNTKDVTYKGNVYTAFPFEITPAKQDNRGEIPTVTLTVSNVTQLLEPYLDEQDGGVGASVVITVINAAHLDEDYAELEMAFDVLACYSTAESVVFTLGAPNPLRQQFPLRMYLAQHCGFVYEGAECGYVGKDISGITRAANAKISCTGHPFSVDDTVKITDVEGMTEINNQTGTVVDADPDEDGNAFTVDIDSTGYSTYTSGGKAGFATCGKTLGDCDRRENATRFGGFPGIRSGSVRLA